MLLDAGAEPSISPIVGKTPLDLAREKGNQVCIDMMEVREELCRARGMRMAGMVARKEMADEID